MRSATRCLLWQRLRVFARACNHRNQLITPVVFVCSAQRYKMSYALDMSGAGLSAFYGETKSTIQAIFGIGGDYFPESVSNALVARRIAPLIDVSHLPSVVPDCGISSLKSRFSRRLC